MQPYKQHGCAAAFSGCSDHCPALPTGQTRASVSLAAQPGATPADRARQTCRGPTHQHGRDLWSHKTVTVATPTLNAPQSSLLLLTHCQFYLPTARPDKARPTVHSYTFPASRAKTRGLLQAVRLRPARYGVFLAVIIGSARPPSNKFQGVVQMVVKPVAVSLASERGNMKTQRTLRLISVARSAFGGLPPRGCS